MRKILTNTGKNWKQLSVAVTSAFFGFVLFYPDIFPPLIVRLADYVAAGGLTGFGLAGVHRAYGGKLRSGAK